jgi:hypothetical protein
MRFFETNYSRALQIIQTGYFSGQSIARRLVMLFILPVFFIIMVWIILNHLRKRAAMREYIELRKKAIEKGVSEPVSDEFLYELSSGDSSLRIGIIALILGAVVLVLGGARWLGLFMPGPVGLWGAARFFMLIALIVCAFGLGSVLIWLFVDRPKRDRLMRLKDRER